jgi:hypothetical protein
MMSGGGDELRTADRLHIRRPALAHTPPAILLLDIGKTIYTGRKKQEKKQMPLTIKLMENWKQRSSGACEMVYNTWANTSISNKTTHSTFP